MRKLAEKEYGDPLDYPIIVEATNAKAAEDASFTIITNPDIIEIGQKVWLPTEPAGTEAPGMFQSEGVIGIYKAMTPAATWFGRRSNARR